MKISYNQLKKLIHITETPEEIGHLLTSTGLEVEDIERIDAIKGGLEGVVIGQVLTCEQHPNADRLRKTTVDIGGEAPLHIVCGAPNVAAGQKVLVATVGATLYPTSGEAFTIKSSKIRGEVSEGMICAEDELGLGESHAGILVLPPDLELPLGSPAATYFNLEPDYRIEIGLTPNRADAASHYGVARDLKAVLQRPICLPSVEDFKEGNTPSAFQVSIHNAEACPRFCGLEMAEVQVGPSPEWLKRLLATIGVNSINNVVDVTNYICHVLGQPMHVFDADKVVGQHIHVRVPEAGTTLTTLDGIERKLSGHDLAICDSEKPMAIAGVFGGNHSGVTAATTRIFLEVAYFNPAWIRKTGTFHGLKTDASFRYERGTDPHMPPYAIQVAALLMAELAGAQPVGQVLDVYPNAIGNMPVVLKYRNINRLIGKELSADLISSILESLDIEVVEKTDEGLTVAVPPYRVDVQREADVVEEILRIYGFDNIELSENLASDFLSDFPAVDEDSMRLRISELLAANGFNEIQSLSIVKPSQNEPLRALAKGEQVELLNPLSEDLSVMRQGLLFSGLEALVYNINRRQNNLKFFEFGRAYYALTSESGKKYKDNLLLGVWLTGHKAAETWHQKSESVEFYDLAVAVQQILGALRATQNLTQTDAPAEVFAYGLTYAINKKPVVSFGLVKNSLLKHADLKQPVFYAEFDWEYLLKRYTGAVHYTEISKFPEVRRDLSLVVDKGITFAQLETIARQTERNLLRQINVFDIYEGDKLEAGKKSYSVSFTLLDTTQTLTDKAIDKSMNRLIQAFESQAGAVIRR